MEASTYRPATAGARSARGRGASSFDDEAQDDAQHGGRPPARPSTQRSGRSPRTENVASMARRFSGGADSDPVVAMRSELATLSEKLSKNDLVKAQLQVQLQRQGVEMAKLERYIGQLVDDRGGVDAGTMETIVKDLEKSTLVKKAQKQVADLKFDLSRKEKQIAELKMMQTSEYVLKLAEEKEALAVKVETLVIESSEGGARNLRGASQSPKKLTETTELERLRAQNLAMRTDSARLRAELELAKTRGRAIEDRSRSHGDRRDFSGEAARSEGGDSAGHGPSRRLPSKNTGNARVSSAPHGKSGGAAFYEGQAVECRKVDSNSWRSATIDSVKLTIEPLGSGGSGASRTYLYTVWYDEGASEDGIPEHRIRAAGDGLGSASAGKVLVRNGETVIRSTALGPGDSVLARDDKAKGKWSSAEVLRRNENGTYHVAFDGTGEKKDFHRTMLRATETPEGTRRYDDDSYRDGHSSRDENQATNATTKPVATSPAEEAELRYAEKREALVALARETVPGPFNVGQEVLAKYMGSTAWGSGVVRKLDKHRLHLDIQFDSGELEEGLPFIFVRPQRQIDLSSDESVRAGDAVLARGQGAVPNRDWFPARFRCHEDNGYCSVVFGSEGATTSVQATRVRRLYRSPTEHYREEIPGIPPPPTKPVRSKKHHEGDIILACIPTIKAWTPAMVTEVKGRGRYSVQWADGMRADSLLFMHIASLRKPAKEARRAVTDGPFCSNEPTDGKAGSGNGRVDRGEKERGMHGENKHGEATEAHIRLRQRQLTEGEPVLAKKLSHDSWAPGSIKAVLGGGKYDVQFTDGTTAEDLSFLFVRGLGFAGSNESGDETTVANRPEGSEPNVGDEVYVLKRGYSPEEVASGPQDRDLWRVGTVTDAYNGRYTVQYGNEEGKPKESRIAATRLRQRNVIRQKAAQKGDVVMALSRTPGRGWLMGAVTERLGDGKYRITFSDGSEEDGVSFVNLRRVIGSDANEKDDKVDKRSSRAIRQRRFHVGEVALVKNSETHKWGVARVLEVLPSGRYDLEFLEEGNTIAMGVSFQSMRHLDLAEVSSNSQVITDGDRAQGSPRAGADQSRERCTTAESWDEHNDSGNDNNDERSQKHGTEFSGQERPRSRDDSKHHAFETGESVMLQETGTRAWREATIGENRSRGRYDVKLSDGSVASGVEPSRIRRDHDGKHAVRDSGVSDIESLDVGSEVYVLRRGKRHDADIEDTDAWRPGKIVSVRSNGTFAVEYHEAGAPKEDRIAGDRVRRRCQPRARDSGGRGRGHSETFEEGDVVLAATEGSDRHKATVESFLGESQYRVRFLDGSGTKNMESYQLRHLTPPDEGRYADPPATDRRVVNTPKLYIGQRVLACKPNGTADGQEWLDAQVTEIVCRGHCKVLFTGDAEITRVHFTKVKPLGMPAESGAGSEDSHQYSKVNSKSRNQNNRKDLAQGSSHSSRNNGDLGEVSGFLQVTEPCFSLSMTASAARHTSPNLILATGERRQDHNPPWLQNDAGNDVWSSGDRVGFLARGASRPGTRNPIWKGKEGGVFWLSLEGLEDPALYVALEDGRKKSSKDGRAGERVSEDAIMAEACVPIPREGVRAGGKSFEVELNNGAGTVRLQWSTQDDHPSVSHS